MAAVELDLRIEGIAQVIGAMGSFYKELSSPENRRRIANAAAPLVVAAIQGETPISERKHFRYRTPKLIGRLRAPKGFGKVVASYAPGNLQKSVINLADRRSKYKKIGNVIIGPIYSRTSKGENIGSSKRNADGYYAHMVLGSSEAFQQQIAIRGAKKVEGTAYTVMIVEANDIVNELKFKNGFAE